LSPSILENQLQESSQRAKKQCESQDLIALADLAPASRTPGVVDVVKGNPFLESG
jgi:hypothetical protein